MGEPLSRLQTGDRMVLHYPNRTSLVFESGRLTDYRHLPATWRAPLPVTPRPRTPARSSPPPPPPHPSAWAESEAELESTAPEGTEETSFERVPNGPGGGGAGASPAPVGGPRLGGALIGGAGGEVLKESFEAEPPSPDQMHQVQKLVGKLGGVLFGSVSIDRPANLFSKLTLTGVSVADRFLHVISAVLSVLVQTLIGAVCLVMGFKWAGEDARLDQLLIPSACEVLVRWLVQSVAMIFFGTSETFNLEHLLAFGALFFCLQRYTFACTPVRAVSVMSGSKMANAVTWGVLSWVVA